MAYLKDHVLSVLAESAIYRLSNAELHDDVGPSAGNIGWCQTPDDCLWPATIADPSDADSLPELQAEIEEAESSKLLVRYFVGVTDDDDTELGVVDERDYIAWGGQDQDLLEFSGAMFCVEDSSHMLEKFLRSVQDARNSFSIPHGAPQQKPPHKFCVGWNLVPGFPKWPCISVPYSVAKRFVPSLGTTSVAVSFFDYDRPVEMNSMSASKFAQARFGDPTIDAQYIAEAREDLNGDLLVRFEWALLYARRFHAALMGTSKAHDAAEEAQNGGSSATTKVATVKRKRLDENAVFTAAIEEADASGVVSAAITNLHAAGGLIHALEISRGRARADIVGPRDARGKFPVLEVSAEVFSRALVAFLQSLPAKALTWSQVELIARGAASQPSQSAPASVAAPVSASVAAGESRGRSSRGRGSRGRAKGRPSLATLRKREEAGATASLKAAPVAAALNITVGASLESGTRDHDYSNHPPCVATISLNSP
jgi:hypothetical protein